VLAGLACEREAPPPAPSAPAAVVPRFVGGARCASCHAAETEAWRGSDHDRAMEVASAESLLGDFANARFELHGAVTTFSERDGRRFVNTQGPDGAAADFEVAYTFGVDPLQQLLLPLPRGRLQALSVAWDARPRAAGGQRWYSLYPDERVPPGDVLHWTQLSQSWNGGCADCHSTNLRRGYDLAQDAYDTTWSDLDVGCEACHGPGARHVAWAEHERSSSASANDDRGLSVPLADEPARWVLAEGAAIAKREPSLRAHTELEVCAPCHARRTLLRESDPGSAPFLDTHRPALLEEGLYEADGQIRGEVYEYGSFVQSRMYAAGVTCSDCHEPHSLALRAEGNALCGQCHRPAVFDTPEHHHHPAGSAGADCVACHMPTRTYMGVDLRHDHSLRVPRPDLSVALGTPNACSDCHSQRTPRWAADATRRWFPKGRSGTPHFATALHAGRDALPGAEPALIALAGDAAQPGIARATAFTLLVAPDLPATAAAIRRGLADPDGLVRLGALGAARGLEPATRLAALKPLLEDPLLAVRSEAARALAELPPALWSPPERSRLAERLTEYRAVQRVNADRPEAHVNLAGLDALQGDFDAARSSYQRALRIAKWFVPAYVNLADLERSAGREDAAEAALRQALSVAPELAEPHFALGLLLIRTGRRAEAFAELSQAAALAPDNARITQALALTLEDRGERERAQATLETALARRPGDRELLAAAAFLAREHGDRAAAQRHLRALVAAWPDDTSARELLTGLEQGVPAPPHARP
jgi:predicted CXXCH cytochrome family protein